MSRRSHVNEALAFGKSELDIILVADGHATRTETSKQIEWVEE